MFSANFLDKIYLINMEDSDIEVLSEDTLVANSGDEAPPTEEVKPPTPKKRKMYFFK